MLIDTPVDEYGNHTLNNGLVACLLNKEDIKAEQYGSKGDGEFDNSEAFIHLFAHMKKGKITFKKNAIYLMPQRNKDNISDVYTTVINPYAPYMCGRSSGCQRPIMANIDGVELIGENSTLKIKDNDWNTAGTADFALLNLFRVIRNLKIHGLIFDNNGLTMDYTNSVENHGIAWKQGNTMIDSGKAPIIDDGTVHEISNVEIYDCEFKNGGTTRAVNDCGGDGILIINPMENCHDINIHNNKFINWGRWCFAIDLGGNGERLQNIEFNYNYCIQDETNKNLEGKYRGLGWIDFEAKKCFTNLKIIGNYVSGLTPFAFNGDGKISNNVIIKDNVLIRASRSYMGAYPYMWNFYGVQIKDCIFENNDFSMASGSNRLGYSYNNVIIRNNKFCNSNDAMSISRPIGNINIDGNELSDKGKIINISYFTLPDYFSEEDKNNIELNLTFKNNKGGISGKLINKDYLNNEYLNLTIENNVMELMDITYFGNEWIFDPSQVIASVPAFSARGAIFTGLTSYNYRYYPNGGGSYKVGDVIAQNSSKKTVCTKEGYLILEGSFKYCESDISFSSNKPISQYSIVYTGDNVYLALNAGKLGSIKPTHQVGSELNGEVNLFYLKKVANIANVVI